MTASPTTGHWEQVRFRGAGVPSVLLEGRIAPILDGRRHPALLLLHPNPAHGGTMDNKILRAVADALYPEGVGSLRYNSRGVGGSRGTITIEGTHIGDLTWVEGSAETSDVGAALDYLAVQPWVDHTRIALVGFSFGSRIALAHLAAHPADSRIRAVVAIGFPLASRDLSHLGQWRGPKLFLTGEHDVYCPPAALIPFVDRLPPPALHAVLHGVDHFLPGREPAAGALAAAFLRPILLGG